MIWTALLLSRVQFAFTVSFHIIFPSFTIELAAWLTILEAFWQRSIQAAVPAPFRPNDFPVLVTTFLISRPNAATKREHASSNLRENGNNY